MSLKRRILPAVDIGLAVSSAGMNAVGRLTPWGYAQVPTFSVDGTPVRHFIHRHNAFYPPYRMTERTVELALADIFLRSVRDRPIVEIGAVTPYYWPERIKIVVDPADDHLAVTHRIGWEDWDIGDEALLSMSTFEHIGSGEYGLAPNPAATRAAVDKLLAARNDFLVTYPAGYNAALDAYMKSVAHEDGHHRVMVWHRGPRGNDWRQIEYRDVTPSMEAYMPGWAQTLVALYRGRDDIWSDPRFRDSTE